MSHRNSTTNTNQASDPHPDASSVSSNAFTGATSASGNPLTGATSVSGNPLTEATSASGNPLTEATSASGNPFTAGSHVTFGNYHGKDLRWKVLVRDGRRCLLFADMPVDEHPFHPERIESTWNSCELRKWLNRDFMNEAFSLQERMMIILHRNENSTDDRWGDNNGPDTKDKLYVFTRQELEEFVPEHQDRAIGVWWWLRGHGCSNLNQQAVYEDGTVYTDGVSCNSVGVGVRPAMWIQLKS